MSFENIGRIYDKQHEISESDLAWRFEDMDGAQKKLERANAAFIAHMRAVNHTPPAPSTLQASVQKLSDHSALISTGISASFAAAHILMGSNPWSAAGYAALSMGHHMFDAKGGYEWLGRTITAYTGWSEQSGITAASALRMGAHAASIAYGVKQLASKVIATGVALPAFSWDGLKGLGMSLRGLAGQTAADGSNALLEYGSKGAIAIGAGYSVMGQVKMMRAHEATSRGQFNQAEAKDLLQSKKEAHSALTSSSKGAKGVLSDTRRIEDILKKTVETRPQISFAA